MRGYRRGGHRLDGPQKEIVAALRKVTVVVNLSQGTIKDCPDLLARHRQGWPIWLEIKSATGGLTDGQQDFAADWLQAYETRINGRYYRVVRTVDEALRAVGAMP